MRGSHTKTQRHKEEERGWELVADKKIPHIFCGGFCRSASGMSNRWRRALVSKPSGNTPDIVEGYVNNQEEQKCKSGLLEPGFVSCG